MTERNWTFTVTLTVPDDVEAGDAAVIVADVLDEHMPEDCAGWKIGAFVLTDDPDCE